MQRLDHGERIRQAMAEEKLSIVALARKTKDVDPNGFGVSKSLIGALVSTGSTARERCRDLTGTLIAAALNREPDALFGPNAD